MPVLIIAVVFFIIFLIMGVMLSSAMFAEHHTNNIAEHETEAVKK
jgi:preprotein translocase subunit SecG